MARYWSPAVIQIRLVASIPTSGFDTYLKTAEIFTPDYVTPADGTWTATGSMTGDGRSGHVAVRLSDRTVLAAGGDDFGSVRYLSSAEIFTPNYVTPASGAWATTDSMDTIREGAGATLLADGTVLVVGGDQDASGGLAAGPYVNTAEIYTPGGAGSWDPTTGAMGSDRYHPTVTLLFDWDIRDGG